MWPFKNKLEDIEKKKEKENEHKQALERQRTLSLFKEEMILEGIRIQKEKNQLKEKEQEENQKCRTIIDFETINAILCERQYYSARDEHDKKWKTIIGFRDEDGEVNYWYFYVTIEEHNKIVEEFQEYLKRKQEVKQ